MGIFDFRLGRSKKVTPDIAMADEAVQSDEGWDAIRNPELGAWRITVIRRSIWAVMMLSLPISLFAACSAWKASSGTSAVEDDLLLLQSQAADVWYPTQSVNAQAYADQIAGMLGMEIVAPFETYSQAFAFGASPEMLVGPFPEALDLGQRYTWADLGDTERYGYLLSTQGRNEVLSFIVTDAGDLGWPTITPPDPAASSTFSTGSQFALQMSLPADDGPAVSPDRLKFPDYYRALDLLGAASDESSGTSCGSARDTDAGTGALTERLEGFVSAYTSQNTQELVQIAGEGAEWPVYPRQAWRYRPGSLRVLCTALQDGTGVAQIWWLAESTRQESVILPETRDVAVRDAGGFWLVSGAAPLMSLAAPTN